jgi:hypothetical protein
MSLKVRFPIRGCVCRLMLLQQEIDINVAALKAYDVGEYEVALKTFEVWGIVSEMLTGRKLPTHPGFTSIWV